ncbi:hypothetical protein BDP67DRAFT_492087 [Colletotrichum lupini]|nr:hypothetical protein BDP67DRAFT_492087 [Colletotrichum lupini]
MIESKARAQEASVVKASNEWDIGDITLPPGLVTHPHLQGSSNRRNVTGRSTQPNGTIWHGGALGCSGLVVGSMREGVMPHPMASEQPTWMQQQQQPQAARWAQAGVPTKQVHNPANAKAKVTQPEKARDSAHPEIKYSPSRPLRLRASSPFRPFSVREPSASSLGLVANTSETRLETESARQLGHDAQTCVALGTAAVQRPFLATASIRTQVAGWAMIASHTAASQTDDMPGQTWETSRRCVRQTSSLAVAKAAADDRPFFGVLWADLVEKRINVGRSLANHDELNRDQPTESENCYNGLEPDVVP